MLKHEVTMTAGSVGLIDEGDARIEAVKGAIVPRVLRCAKSCLPIRAAECT
jgi:hypothetical protein